MYLELAEGCGNENTNRFGYPGIARDVVMTVSFSLEPTAAHSFCHLPPLFTGQPGPGSPKPQAVVSSLPAGVLQSVPSPRGVGEV